MIRVENDCCGCAVPAYPCLGNSCPLRHQKHYYCDNCGDEVDKLYLLDDGYEQHYYCDNCGDEVDKLYLLDDGYELCEQCVLDRLEVVE